MVNHYKLQITNTEMNCSYGYNNNSNRRSARRI